MLKLTRKTLVALLFAAGPLSAAQAQTPTPPLTPAPVISAQRVVDAFAATGLATLATPMSRVDYGKAPFVCKGLKFVLPATEPPALGRAFYCARKADGERLERYYTALSKSRPAQAVNVLTQRPFVVVLDGVLSTELVEKYRAALPTLADGSVAPKAATPITVTVERMNYVNWGRPYYMYDPSQPCTSTDKKVAVLLLQVVVAITNNSPTQTMSVGSWHGQFYRQDGAPATTCNYTARGRVTNEPLKTESARAQATQVAEDILDGQEQVAIPPGGTAGLTYAVFVELNDRVAYGEITDSVLGKSNRIEVPLNLPLP
jgi:hypothetical protein